MTLLTGRVAPGIINFRQVQFGGAVPIIVTNSIEFGGNTTTRTITKPSGVVSGDLLVCIIGVDESGTGGQTLTPPSDAVPWIEIDQGQPPGNGMTCGLWYKIAGGSEPADYQWTNTSSEGWAMSMFRISGHDPSVPINDFSFILQDNNGSDDHWDLTGVTTNITNCLLLHYWQSTNELNWPDPPFGFIAPFHDGVFVHNQDGGGTQAVNFMVGEEDFTRGGATGVRRYDGRDSLSSLAPRGGGMIAIAPPGGSKSFLKFEDDDFHLLEASEGRLLLEV